MAILAALYGLVVYLFFLATFVYAIGFVGDLPLLPKTIDSGAAVPLVEALAVNLALLGLFAVQHSVMARRGFKRWWTKLIPESVERSTFVLAATAALALLLWQWRPIAEPVLWSVSDPAARFALACRVLARLGRAADQHLPDQPLRAVRPAPGVGEPARPGDRGPGVSHTAVLPPRAAPDLPRLRARLLGHAANDRGPPAVRGGLHGLHPDRHLVRGARPRSRSSASATARTAGRWACCCPSSVHAIARGPRSRDVPLIRSTSPTRAADRTQRQCGAHAMPETTR